MNRLVFYIVLLLLAGLFGCDDYAMDPGFTSPINPNSPQPPNRITLKFQGGIITDQSNWFLNGDSRKYFKNFDKHNYPGIISIVFAPELKSISFGNYGYVQLYNVTDSIPIAGSELRSSSQEWLELRSEDIINSFPEKKITLAIRLRSENEGFYVVISSVSYLYLYTE